MSNRTAPTRLLLALRRAARPSPSWVALLLLVASACREPSPFAQALEARRIVAGLEAQFARSVDASQRAVMASDVAATNGFKQESEAGRAAVVRDIDALAQTLRRAEFEDEQALLARFQSTFTAYQLLDRNILGLAGEETKLGAQRPSFGAVLAEKRTLTLACDESLHALEVALARRIAPVQR